MRLRNRIVWTSLVLAACSRPSPPSEPNVTVPSAPAVSPESAWLLQGGPDERFARVAKHLRGFDVAMVEVGYRYAELFFAGRDGNWGYADYQLKKIETAVANGVERRPRRAASARMLDAVLPAVRAAITAKNAEAFAPAFSTLTATCNACHQAEQVPFITVRPPTVRFAPVGTENP